MRFFSLSLYSLVNPQLFTHDGEGEKGVNDIVSLPIHPRSLFTSKQLISISLNFLPSLCKEYSCWHQHYFFILFVKVIFPEDFKLTEWYLLLLIVVLLTLKCYINAVFFLSLYLLLINRSHLYTENFTL
jgi:hypothetical protein